MPGRARKKSESGIYHVMLRGINRQQIFEDAEDCYKFLAILTEYKEQLNALDSGSSANYPTLTVTAYAVQYAGSATAADAWAKSPQIPNFL